jgi:hypothetical protein
VILYTCGQRDNYGSVGHACGRAANALDDAGYEYEIKEMPGYRMAPWTWGDRRGGRDEVKELTGDIKVPVLLLDEGEAIAGSGTIVEWAKAHPKAQPEVGGG